MELREQVRRASEAFQRNYRAMLTPLFGLSDWTSGSLRDETVEPDEELSLAKIIVV